MSKWRYSALGAIPQNCANGKKDCWRNGLEPSAAVVIYTDGNVNCIRQANVAEANSNAKNINVPLLNYLFTPKRILSEEALNPTSKC